MAKYWRSFGQIQNIPKEQGHDEYSFLSASFYADC
jgi:hypothetical protein